MKPNFALSLSFEGIRLARRAMGGWRVVGDVALDSDDLAGELAILRKTAAALEPAGVRTKLLIPNDQIKYMTIATPGLSDAARLRQAEHALEGATPYDVKDLVFDISVNGAQTHIAAVARETLAEAEAFATEYRFHPVSFAAQPSGEEFLGEPFFGKTNSASSLLEDGDDVERDTETVTIIGNAGEPESPDPATPHDTPTAPKPPDAADDEASAEGPSPALKNENPRKEAESQAVDSEQNGTGAPEKTMRDQGEKPVNAPPRTAENPVKRASPEASTPGVPPHPGQTVAGSQSPATRSPSPQPQPSVGVPDRAPPKVTNIKPKDAGSDTAAFASRRSPPDLGGASRNNIGPASKKPVLPHPVPDSSSLLATAPVPQDKPVKRGFLSRRKAHSPAVPSSQIARSAQAGASAGSGGQSIASEADRMTVFGARKPHEVKGKPRFLGLLLTMVLLLFLAGVAAWASVFLDDGIALSRLFGSRESTVQATADPLPTDETTTDVVPPSEPVLASLDPTLTDTDGAVLDALRVPELTAPKEMTPRDIDAKYATSGIWVMAPEMPTPSAMIGLDDLYLTSIDPVSTANDAIALPDAASFASDQMDLKPASPAAVGTAFALDSNGLVIPTSKGAINPDGVMVFAGRPVVVPPQIERAQPEQPSETAVDKKIAGSRPKVRPADLVEQNERSVLDGLTRTELAALRPEERPTSAQQIAAEAAQPAVAETAEPSTPDNPAASFENATAFAVRSSIRPDTRPDDFARRINRAEAAAPAPTRVASAASAIAPKVVQPSLPSKASVAKQATVKNAIKLREINLIGVYGKPSSRRALIRLSNGRYQKVAVGDTLDGGRVLAIGDNELRYKRRGRDVVLRMPRS
ncbi:MAG: hypothetical protein V7763_07040 [Sulfitobacter sp.]